jgi:predicted nucleic acid-binding protein
MRLTITDANIFIDLIKLQMLGFLFSIKLSVYTTREVADQLNDDQYDKISSFIQAQLLTVVDFTITEIEEIAGLQVSRALEFADKTVIYLALKLKAEVLTGDGPLRKACQNNALTVHGILWVFQ